MNPNLQITRMTPKQTMVLNLMQQLAKENIVEQPDIVRGYAKIKDTPISPSLRVGIGVVLKNLTSRGFIKLESIKPSPYGIISINVWRVNK